MSDVTFESVLAQAEQLDVADKMRLMDHLARDMPLLPEEERNELAALRFLSDAALWTIAREQMPQAQQARMEVLMTGNNFGTLTEAETQELHAMVEEGNRLMLRKAQAMALLTERGYTITFDALEEG